MGGMKDLFGDEPYGEAHARHTDPHTSHEAAAAIKPDVNNIEGTVTRAVQRSGERGMICDEVVDATGLDWNTVSPRMAPLRRKKLIYRRTDEKTGKYLTRRGKSGKAQQIHWYVR